MAKDGDLPDYGGDDSSTEIALRKEEPKKKPKKKTTKKNSVLGAAATAAADAVDKTLKKGVEVGEKMAKGTPETDEVLLRLATRGLELAEAQHMDQSEKSRHIEELQRETAIYLQELNETTRQSFWRGAVITRFLLGGAVIGIFGILVTLLAVNSKMNAFMPLVSMAREETRAGYHSNAIH